MSYFGREVAVAGVGYSDFTRNGEPDPRLLARRAVTAAATDAGIPVTMIDGMFHYKFNDDVSVQEIQSDLGIPDLAVFSDTTVTGPSGLTSALEATQAVASGACDYALAIRCITRRTGYAGAMGTDEAAVPGIHQYLAPYGWGSTGVLPGFALRKRRRMAQYGTTAEEYGYIALNARKWAKDNERAVLRQELTMDEYLSARVVADPLLVLDCDYPVNGAVAVLFTTKERAADLRNLPVVVDSFAYSTGKNPDAGWMFGDDFLHTSAMTCAERLWSRTSLTVDDIDVAQIYDGFTHVTISWVEALGFCGLGEFTGWVEEGRRIGPGGSLPMNTSGGHLAEGRVHGLQFLAEAALQLRGECGVRQVADAQTAVITSAFGAQTGAMLVRTGDA
jgi:acetyl-CoA acetyltransferase